MRIFCAPGRVNLIGEHTDYNQGFVLPAALNLACRITVFPHDANRLTARSVNLKAEVSWPIDRLERRGNWGDYIAGVAVALRGLGVNPVPAMLEIDSSVPPGAGVSSSAALEAAAALALCALAGKDIPRVDLARACQRADSEFVGVRCGIMDQFVSLLGCKDHALLLDCRSLHYRLVPLPQDCALVMVNTMVRHELASSEYNRRRQECDQAAAMLRYSLREANLAAAERHPEPWRGRARHVISENARLHRFVAALERNDLIRAGELMYESHNSLRDDYGVSCRELDFLVEAARKIDGVIGARMTGGGFGGSTVNLVRTRLVPEFRRRIAARYREHFGMEPEIYVCHAAGGASEETA